MACGGCARLGTSGGAGVSSGRFVYAENEDVKSLNPMLATSGPAIDLSMFVFSYAVRYDDHARPVADALREVPTLANGDVSRDGLTLKYKLRPNVYFHDGVHMTCRDLAFTWHAALNPANNNLTHDGYSDIKSIDCSDPLAAVVHMKRVYAPFLQQLWGVNSNVPILPEHILAKYNDAKGSFNNAPFQSAPVGSGPFAFVRWDRGQQVVLKAFDRYFLGKPKLREVVFKSVPDDQTLVNQLHTHEIDMAARLGVNAWPAVQGIPGVTAIATPSFEYVHIDFNLKRPIFGDVRVRRALAMGLDRQGILDKISHGLGDLTKTELSPELSPDYDPNVPSYPYDPAKARALLDQAGWHVGARGIRVKGGQRFAFTYGTQTESQTGRAIETYVQNAWHQLGADVSVKNQPTAQFFDNTTNGVLQGGHYDVAGFTWIAASDPDDSPIYSPRNLAPSGQNALFWNDPIVARAMDAELATVDPVKRRAAFDIEQQRFATDVPSIILYYRREPYIYNSRLEGFRPSPVISPFWNPQEYSL